MRGVRWLVTPMLALAVLGATLPGFAASEDAPRAPDTGLTWSRGSYGGSLTIDATRGGPRFEEAKREVRAIARRLDALRTLEPHVVWTRIQWEDGRIEVDARAASALYANVAMLAVRRFLGDDYGSAGSGVRPREVDDEDRYGWSVRLRAGPTKRPGGK